MSRDPEHKSDRLFGWLLRLFPREFRGDFGEQMIDDFRDQREEARAGGRFASPGLWMRTVAGVLGQAPREHGDMVRRDIQYAIRLLRRSPGFTAVAVLTLAFGIGTNTAIFSLADGMLFRPLPFHDPDRLVLFRGFSLKTGQAYSRVLRIDFEQFKANHTGISAIAAVTNTGPLTWTGSDGPESISVSAGTPNLLEMLGVGAHIGRPLRRGDEEIKPTPVMLTHAAWRRRFAEDRSVVGRTIAFDQRTVQIVGILPPRFIYPVQGTIVSGELLMAENPPPTEANDPRAGVWMPVGRLRPGVTIEQAQAETDLLIRRTTQQFPGTEPDRALQVGNLQFAMFELSRPIAWLLLGAAACVLLIACANMAALLMARAVIREREIGIRVAIGAGRGRIMRQLFAESLVLGALAGVVSLLVGWLTFRSVTAYVPTGIYRLLPDSIDTRAVAFTAIVSIAASVLFAVVPALSLSRRDVTSAIRDRRHLRRTGGLMKAGAPLVAAEVAIGFILFAGTALTVNSLIRMRTVDLGFEPDRVVPLFVAANRSLTAAGRYDFYDQLLQSVRRLPQADVAAGIDIPHWGGAAPMRHLRRSGPRDIGVWSVTPRFFETARVPILRGRDFSDDDLRQNAAVAIVNETAARLLWPGEDPIEKLLDADDSPRRRVIGVVKDVRSGYGGIAGGAAYWPLTREGFRFITVLARTSGDPAALAAAMRTTAQRLDPRLVVGRPQTVGAMLERSIATARFETLLFTLFGVLGLIVTTIGVYGLMAFWVGSRTQEMGIRMALGADAAKLKSLVLRQASLPLVAGIAFGLIGAFLLTRRLESLLHGITPRDPSTFAAVVLVLVAAGLGAAYVPARRAARVDPIVTLRTE